MAIEVIQTELKTGREKRAPLCSRYLNLISEGLRRAHGPLAKRPGEVLDALLWGDQLTTDRYGYRLAQ